MAGFGVSVTVSLPKREQAKKKWLEAIASKQRAQSVPLLRKLFKQTVFGWSTKPDMGWSQTKSNDEIVLRIYPIGAGADKWTLLNQGSPAHVIRPRQAKILSFRPGYRAATRPGSLQSSRAYRSGKFMGASIINHPGFEARRFTESMVLAYADNYTQDMQDAISEVANRK